ncbi:MANSC domain-containing protein 4 [Indicator indicator]|uniref:MANSC domain-containing protein 4 n=1 Tax=Indicator indicator TaxID=1002788 RepID=UPI0023E01C8D|nr:MANSC domain-containing protein 4 [Indicator indicator]
MVLLVAAALLVLGLAVKSEALCSPTSFYKDCWIRRFPGLLIDLQESQKRGAQVLKVYAEVSPQQCSRSCCLLSNASCNLAVFYHGAIHENMNCLHVSCPALESCILKARINVVLYNITTGTDPDLLLFGKLAPPEASPHLPPSEHERQNSTKATKQERCQHLNTTSRSLLIQAPSATSSYSLPASSTSLRVTTPAIPAHSRAEALPTDDPLAMRTSTASGSSRSVLSSDKTVHSTLTPKSAKVVSPMPTPPGLNSSKQHSNETKGYSGRNYTSENQAPPWEPAALGVWLIPLVLCSSLIFLCCCSAAFTAGHCSSRKGHYTPTWRKRTTSRQVIKYSTAKGSC